LEGEVPQELDAPDLLEAAHGGRCGVETGGGWANDRVGW
jgi:hypothetical protein